VRSSFFRGGGREQRARTRSLAILLYWSKKTRRARVYVHARSCMYAQFDEIRNKPSLEFGWNTVEENSYTVQL
jgi:hypothetical protein